MNWLFLVLAVLSGAVLPIQAAANARMKTFWGHPIGATLVNFLVGSVVLVAALLLMRVPWPGTARLGEAPWWAWIGGFCGALMVGMAVFLSPKIGTAAFFSAMVAGQLGASLLVDHFGLMGLAAREISPTKLVGVGLVVLGVVIFGTQR